MPENQDRNTTYTDFILIAFSGPKEWRQILFLPFLMIFLIAIVANFTLIGIIATQNSLHSPMYILIGLKAFVDVTQPIFFVPNMLFSLLFDWNHISLVGCLVQMFCIHLMGTFQTTLLLWMALDRYYAICKPLRYNDYMAFSAFMKFIFLPCLRNTVLITAVVALAGSLSYCQGEIDHCFCEHMALVTLSCGTYRINNIVGLTTIFSITVTDLILISVSYVKIFVSVAKSGKSNPKALSTCITHIMAFSVNTIFVLTSLLSYRIRNNMSPNTHSAIASMYLLFPSCFDPIIYGVRTKEIRRHIMKVLKCGKVTNEH